MIKNMKPYIPDIRFVKKLQEVFNADLKTKVFNAEEDLQEYLCALAYAAIGKELFADESIEGQIDVKSKKNADFMQGMLTYSIIQKVNSAERILNSTEFKAKHTIDFTKEAKEWNSATIAFVVYYMSTKGFNINPKLLKGTYSPLASITDTVEFSKKEKMNRHSLLIRCVEDDLTFYYDNLEENK